MSEIEKLRKRLKNVAKNVTTYNMTVAEAWALANEFEATEEMLKSKVTELQETVERLKINLASSKSAAPADPIIRNIDGGTF